MLYLSRVLHPVSLFSCTMLSPFIYNTHTYTHTHVCVCVCMNMNEIFMNYEIIIRYIFSYLLSPFCNPLLECALLNPLLLLKLLAYNKLNRFWLFRIRIFMDQAGRIPQKHISVSFELKHLCRGILLNGVKWKYLGPFAACDWPSFPALCISPFPVCKAPGGKYPMLYPSVICSLTPHSFFAPQFL